MKDARKRGDTRKENLGKGSERKGISKRNKERQRERGGGGWGEVALGREVKGEA